MAAYRQIYDSRHLQADCQEPGSAPEPYVAVIEYRLPLPFTYYSTFDPGQSLCTMMDVDKCLA